MSETPAPRLLDYHMHAAVTVDSRMKEAEACERALALGIHEIAFTNHVMLNQPGYRMSQEACLAHWQEIEACRERYPDLGIRLGVEMDYYPGREGDIDAALRGYEQIMGRPFDLILGSVHELNGVFFSNKNHAPDLYKDRDLPSVYRDYFEVATQAVRSGLFDVMAHPDLVKKFTNVLTPPLPFSDYRDAVESYLDALLDTGVGMELNTKGLKIPLNEAYPSTPMLELYVSKARVRGFQPVLTLASDAHHVDEVGGCLPEAAALLHSLGVSELACFKARRRSAWKL